MTLAAWGAEALALCGFGFAAWRGTGRHVPNPLRDRLGRLRQRCPLLDRETGGGERLRVEMSADLVALLASVLVACYR